jgi:hypothetical protein
LASLALDGAASGDMGGLFHHAFKGWVLKAGGSIDFTGVTAADGLIAYLPCIGPALKYACQKTSRFQILDNAYILPV